MRGTKRKNVDRPSDDEIEQEQKILDDERRYRAALLGQGDGWQEPKQIKNKLKALVNSGDISQAEICRQLKVTEEDYENFMSLKKQHDNLSSVVYHNAHALIVKREKQGLPILPAAKKQRRDSAQGSSPAKSKESPKKDSNSGPPNISDIHLEGEEREKVPIFDTCNEVRRKINQHIKKYGTSQTQFARDLTEHVSIGENVDGRKIGAILKKSGANAGAKSPVFYAAYVYFEKLRVKDGKAKTKTRNEMEEVWGAGGMSRDHDQNTQYVIGISFSTVIRTSS